MYNADNVITKYNNLFHKIAQKYYVDNPRFSYEDLVAQGQVAGVKAVNSFDPNRGDASFFTYLYQSVNQEVKRFVSDNIFDLKVTEHGQRKEFKRSGNIDDLHRKNTAYRIDHAADRNNHENYKDSSFHDIIASGTMTPEESMIMSESIDIMMNALFTLPDRERFVLEHRYLHGETLQQIADIMNVSKQAVFRWEQLGFSKLQKRVQMKLGKEM